MSYDIDKFVNSNAANVKFDSDLVDNDEDLMTEKFEKDIDFDKINTNASPVLIYELNTKAVAWYDTEMLVGYQS